MNERERERKEREKIEPNERNELIFFSFLGGKGGRRVKKRTFERVKMIFDNIFYNRDRISYDKFIYLVLSLCIKINNQKTKQEIFFSIFVLLGPIGTHLLPGKRRKEREERGEESQKKREKREKEKGEGKGGERKRPRETNIDQYKSNYLITLRNI